MLTLIGLFFFVLAEFVFDYGATPQSTKWSVFYFTLTYISIVLICVDQFFKETSKSILAATAAIGLFFFGLAAMEVSHYNSLWEEYIVSVNENKIRIMLYGLLSIVLIFISVRLWERRLTKK